MKMASMPGTPGMWTRSLLRCGLAAGPVFVTAFLAEGAVREGYDPLRHPVSSLALGPRGWIQAGNFAVTGTLVLAGAAGLSRAGDPVTGRAVPALIGVAGAGLLGSAAFDTDPVSGYPPGTPDTLGHPSRTGTIHNLCGIPVFAGLPAAALTYGLRSQRTGQRAFGRYGAGHRRRHGGGHRASRRGLWPIAPACPSRRPVPARQHHHGFRLAHRAIRTDAAACAGVLGGMCGRLARVFAIDLVPEFVRTGTRT